MIVRLSQQSSSSLKRAINHHYGAGASAAAAAGSQPKACGTFPNVAARLVLPVIRPLRQSRTTVASSSRNCHGGDGGLIIGQGEYFIYLVRRRGAINRRSGGGLMLLTGDRWREPERIRTNLVK